MMIGVSSQNYKTITSHAGKGRRFILFQIDANGHICSCEDIELTKEKTMHETPHGATHVLDCLDVLITGGAGAGFIRKMQDRNVKVILTSLEDPLEAVKSVVAGETLPGPAMEEHFSSEVQHRHGHGHGHGHSHDHGDEHHTNGACNCTCGH